jgi:hypothetical protein
MPRLPTFQSQAFPSVAPAPRITAEDFGAAGFERLRQFGEELRSEVEASEARKALVTQVQLRTKAAEALQRAVAEGRPIEEALEPIVREADEVSFQTRAGAEVWQVYRAQLEETLASQRRAALAERAALEVKTDGEKLLSALATEVMQAPDAYGPAQKDLDAFLATFAGRMDAQKLDGMRTELTQRLHQAAVQSLIRFNPTQAKERLKRGEWTLSPEQRDSLLLLAERVEKAKEADRRQEEEQREQERRRLSNQVRDSIFVGIARGQVKEEDILTNTDLTTEDREHLVRTLRTFREANTSGDVRSDPVVFNRIIAGILAPEDAPGAINDDTAIYQALTSGGLSARDAVYARELFHRVRNELSGSFRSRLTWLRNQVETSLRTNPLFTMDPLLAPRVANEWTRIVLEQAQARRADPKLGRLDDLLDPASKDYVLRPGFLEEIIARNRRRGQPSGFHPVLPAPDGQPALAVGGKLVRPSGPGDVLPHPTDPALELVYKGGDITDPANYEVRSKSGPSRRMVEGKIRRPE